MKPDLIIYEDVDTWLTDLADYFNHKFFSDKLKLNVMFADLQSEGGAVEGLFNGTDIEIYISMSLLDVLAELPDDIISDSDKQSFDSSVAKIEEVLLHEMCHQATQCISGVRLDNDRYDHHGKPWVEWMIKCEQPVPLPAKLGYESVIEIVVGDKVAVHCDDEMVEATIENADPIYVKFLDNMAVECVSFGNIYKIKE